MFGLVVLFALGLYFLVSFYAVRAAVLAAKARGKSHWLWGGLAAFAMYNLIFWDWIPTIAAHQYYCAKDAGFWVYKSVDQWKAENPGVLDTLVEFDGAPSKSQFDPVTNSRTTTFLLNQRFNWLTKLDYLNPLLNLYRTEWFLIDTKTNNVLARYRDFSTAQMRGGGGWYGWKFWLHINNCAYSEYTEGETQMHSILNSVQGLKK